MLSTCLMLYHFALAAYQLSRSRQAAYLPPYSHTMTQASKGWTLRHIHCLLPPLLDPCTPAPSPPILNPRTPVRYPHLHTDHESACCSF